MGINSTQAIILAVLHSGPASGSKIEAQTKTFSGHWNVTRSQIYRELPVLAEKGFVTAGVPDETQRWAQPYSITEAGSAEFNGWLYKDNLHTTQHNPWVLRSKLLELSPQWAAVRAARHADAIHYYQSLLDTETDPLLRDQYAVTIAWFSTH